MNTKKVKFAVAGLLTTSLITNLVLTCLLLSPAQQGTQPHGTQPVIPPVIPPNCTCPGNGTRFYLGQNLWAHICYSEYMSGWILDIRYFFNGKPSIRGVPLSKTQWLLLEHNNNNITNALKT